MSSVRRRSMVVCVSICLAALSAAGCVSPWEVEDKNITVWKGGLTLPDMTTQPVYLHIWTQGRLAHWFVVTPWRGGFGDSSGRGTTDGKNFAGVPMDGDGLTWRGVATKHGNDWILQGTVQWPGGSGSFHVQRLESTNAEENDPDLAEMRSIASGMPVHTRDQFRWPESSTDRAGWERSWWALVDAALAALESRAQWNDLRPEDWERWSSMFDEWTDNPGLPGSPAATGTPAPSIIDPATAGVERAGRAGRVAARLRAMGLDTAPWL